jgi:hypothetical protein
MITKWWKNLIKTALQTAFQNPGYGYNIPLKGTNGTTYYATGIGNITISWSNPVTFNAQSAGVSLGTSDTPATDEDYILSPVAVNGKQFCTTDEANKGKDANGNWLSKLPVDADANGAYHIALKGLYLLYNPQTKKIENEKWFQFMVEKPYLE